MDIGAIRNKSLEVIKELNLPKYVLPLIGLCIGYPDYNPVVKPRFPMKAVFFEDKYSTENAKAGVDEYDVIFKKYLAERAFNARDSNWSKSITNVYSKSIGNLDEEYELLKKQGFISVDKK